MSATGIVDAGPANKLDSILSRAVSSGKSVSLWRLPDSHERYLVIAESVRKINFSFTLEDSPPGFLVAPFDPGSSRYFLPADELFVIRGQAVEPIISSRQTELKPVSEHVVFHRRALPAKSGHAKTGYEALVQDCVDEIQRGNFEKIVPARAQRMAIDPNTDFLEVFDRLCALYPHAFVNFTSSESYGTWIGASPELIVQVDPTLTFRTVAIAATQSAPVPVDLKKVSWTQKEIEEQALVERYIISCFKKIRLREFEEHGPRTVQAGNLLHLKTDFSVDMRATNFPQLGTVMLQLLHPTSAVCGMPLEPSLRFLKDNEHLDRELYSGYLGPVNIMSDTQLFVNLRCMQLLPGSEAMFYAGAGVTIDSIPAQEWEETVMKMSTLRSVIVS